MKSRYLCFICPLNPRRRLREEMLSLLYARSSFFFRYASVFLSSWKLRNTLCSCCARWLSISFGRYNNSTSARNSSERVSSEIFPKAICLKSKCLASGSLGFDSNTGSVDKLGSPNTCWLPLSLIEDDGALFRLNLLPYLGSPVNTQSVFGVGFNLAGDRGEVLPPSTLGTLALVTDITTSLTN